MGLWLAWIGRSTAENAENAEERRVLAGGMCLDRPSDNRTERRGRRGVAAPALMAVLRGVLPQLYDLATLTSDSPG